MIYICYTLLPNLSVRRQVMDTTDLSDFTLMVFKLSDLILPMLVVLFFSRMTRSHFRMLAENKLADVETTLVTPSTHQTYSGMLPGWMAGHYTLEQCQIDLRPLADAAQIHMELGSIVDVDAGTNEGVLLSDGTHLPADCVIAATGARAPGWLKQTALGLDESGYVAVDGQHRSCSHPNVFAAGDICARQDMSVGRSGVHAVHAGPVLSVNLLAALKGGATAHYKPHRRSLYLLACGPRYAIASWGRFSAEGQWVWRWKDWIDRRFIAEFKD
jgi:NADH dehydrogenase FAD-containing subunit